MLCKYCKSFNVIDVRYTGLLKCAQCKSILGMKCADVEIDNDGVNILGINKRIKVDEEDADIPRPDSKKMKSARATALNKEGGLSENVVYSKGSDVSKYRSPAHYEEQQEEEEEEEEEEEDDEKVVVVVEEEEEEDTVPRVMPAVEESVGVRKTSRSSKKHEREKCTDYQTFLSGYKSIVQSVCGAMTKLNSLSKLNETQKDVLVTQCSSILHHCQLIWNETASHVGVQSGNIQLPKDCMIRTSAAIYFTIHQYLDILVRVNMMDYVNEFNDIVACKKKTPCYLVNIYKFMSLIQEYDLGGRYYKEIEHILYTQNKQGKESLVDQSADSVITPLHVFSSSSTSDGMVKSCIVKMYENLLEGFFFKYVEYSFASEHVTSLYNHCIKQVILQGRSPRVVQVICIYYIIKVGEFISNYEPFDVSKSVIMKKAPDRLESKVLGPGEKMTFIVRSYRVKRGERGVYFDIHDLVGNGNDGKECPLFKKLMDYHLYDVDNTVKALERRKVVFIKNMQKFLKLI